MKTFGSKAFEFFSGLQPDFLPPGNIKFLLPFESAEAKNASRIFFQKYYSDNIKRTFILGINPGRFGAGTTGIAFTDPVRLESVCGVENALPKKSELSSVFIYEVIKAYGGPEKFYKKFFLSAICPIGFTLDGKNLNYYDDTELLRRSNDFIVNTVKEQIKFGAFLDTLICLGEGKNYKCILRLNEEYRFFDKIIPLPHPRFIMQYRRRFMKDYLKKYLDVLDL